MVLNWIKGNPKKIKRYREKHKRRIHKLKLEVFELLGNKCANPNCPILPEKLDKRALQIDHVNGKGNYEIVKVFNRNYLKYYKHVLSQIKSGSKDYQLLCAYCNWLKERKRKGGRPSRKISQI